MDKPEYFSPGPGSHGMTALMSHACWCNVGGVRRELKAGADPNEKDESGFTALIWNCRMGSPNQLRKRKRIFRLLTAHGASIHEIDIKGKTALFHARYFGYRGIRRFIEGEYLRRNRTALREKP